ncbi:MAG: transketolase [Candidatus Harrisonbacteria bacterium RIFCSPLOWO2_02_FULL_41_13b]|uniref:Transketolase n=1 Tax=Candidatus Harrisonbacteria bacterium RIFCSPLOWO2_02_FULL_41_13b TaxID=1798409 RepID=A0A1G1ZRI9_9BACT|nr:MAG: transketolase [Candidatus Harrisonbacteria bacterium RIFCSPLOWO2_02_FULL_41_13b]
MRNSLEELKKHARNIRRSVIEISTPVKSSHTGGSFSAADLLAVLYFEILKIDPKKPQDPLRDIFVYSKGHSSSAFYSTLAERGFFNRKILEEYYRDGGRLPGHPVRNCAPGVEVSSGSLGHGLPMAVGMAVARKYDKSPSRVFAMLSDGECDEGSVWEAIMFSGFHKLDNLIAIVDYNKIQSLGSVKEVLNLEPLKAKWQAFNWAVKEVDGHNLAKIYHSLKKLPFQRGKPSVLIANTIKGKGVSFMENQLAWHYRSLDTPEEYKKAMKEIETS